MENSYFDNASQLASRLKDLRLAQKWSLDDLAARCNVSRATLSRIEKSDVSPTTQVLGRLCTAYGLTLSRLMVMIEADYKPVVVRAEQPVWIDQKTGFRRRSVSPPNNSLTCEVLECELAAAASITYEAPPSPGLEHHLVMLEGELLITVEGDRHSLKIGDCLRYKLFGPIAFEAHQTFGARYHLVVL